MQLHPNKISQKAAEIAFTAIIKSNFFQCAVLNLEGRWIPLADDIFLNFNNNVLTAKNTIFWKCVGIKSGWKYQASLKDKKKKQFFSNERKKKNLNKGHGNETLSDVLIKLLICDE